MSFPRYPEYKESGIDWIGSIPADWETTRLKNAISVIMGQSPSSEDCNQDGQGTPFLQGNAEFGTTFPIAKQFCASAKKHSRKGDLLFSVRAPVGALNVSDRSYAIGRGLCALRADISDTLSFIWWFLPAAKQYFESISTGSTFEAVSAEQVGNLPLVMPLSRREQAEVARFLDHETAKIDALIREQERLIELLQEKRQAVISHAVTKGLDPDVPMKDSGVEWLEEVPAHWRVVPFGYAISYQEGPGIMASDFRDEGVPLLRVSGVQGRWASLKGCNYLDPKKVKKRWKHFQLNHGDLLISASASMGTVCEVDNATVGAVPYTGLIRLTPIAKISHRDFVRAIVGSQQFAVQIDLFKAGSTIQHFGPTHLSQMKVALPPLEEQIQLAEHVDKVTTEFKSLIEEAEKGNKLLKERRTALISAAVTGKIDVRNWQPPQDESAFDEEVRKAGMEATA